MCQIHIGLLFIIKDKTKAIKAFLFLEIVFTEIKGNIKYFTLASYQVSHSCYC